MYYSPDREKVASAALGCQGEAGPGLGLTRSVCCLSHRTAVPYVQRLDAPGQRWLGGDWLALHGWKMDTTNILVWILVGGIAGWLADKFVSSVRLGLVPA